MARRSRRRCSAPPARWVSRSSPAWRSISGQSYEACGSPNHAHTCPGVEALSAHRSQMGNVSPIRYAESCRAKSRRLNATQYHSMPAAPVDRPRPRTSRDFSLLSSKRGQHFPLLALGDLEFIQRGAQLGGHRIEDGWGDLQIEMGVAQLAAGVEKGATRERSEPQGAQPLETWQPASVGLGVPFMQFRVRPDDRGVLQEAVAEAVDDGGDGEDATQALIQCWLGHDFVLLLGLRPCWPRGVSL